MRQYGNRAIMHDFTDSEIITKPSIYVVLQYLCNDCEEYIGSRSETPQMHKTAQTCISDKAFVTTIKFRDDNKMVNGNGEWEWRMMIILALCNHLSIIHNHNLPF